MIDKSRTNARESERASSLSRVFHHFLLISLIAVVAIPVGAGFGLRFVLRRFVILEAEDAAVHISVALRDSEMQRFIPVDPSKDASLSIPKEELPQLDRQLRAFLAPFDIVKIKVFDRDTKIVYSTERAIIGRLDPDNVKLRMALNGTATSKHESKDAVWDLADEERVDVEIVETYVPVRDTGGRIVGCFEIYKEVTHHLAAVDGVLFRAMAVVTVTVLAVFSALVFMMYRATQQAGASAAALRESEKRVREAERMAGLGVLAGGIAHKFNNLLTGVLGNVEFILPELPDGSPLRESMEGIRASATRAAELTGQMLAYAGKGLFLLEDVDLSGLIRETAPALNALTAEGTTLTYALADDLPLIKGGPAQIKQVVTALVTNAAEAVGDEGGTIAIITRAMQAGPENPLRDLQGERLPDGGYAAIEVADTGSGMDEQTMARIFDPFFTTKFTGRGLGLAATLGIVRGHNGAINVESKPGEGTSVRVLLPCLPCPPESAASPDTE